MGMRVASSNNAWAAQANTKTAALQQRQQNSQALFASLSAGDLSGAQSAMTKLSTADSNAQAGASKVNNPNSPFSQIGTALQKGDLKSAQAIAISMQAKNGKHQHGAKALTAENHTNTSTAMNSLTTLLTGSNNTSGSNLQQSIAASTSANLTASNSSASSVLGIGSKINLSA